MDSPVFNIPYEPDWYNETALREAVSADPENADTRIRLAAFLHTDGRLEEALSEYEEAIHLLSSPAPKEELEARSFRSFARFMAAKVLELQGRNMEARGYWQGCVDDIVAVYSGNERHLDQNSYYVEAQSKLASSRVL